MIEPHIYNLSISGVALRNLLKLPKGHKWVCYEFFYSNLDQVLFEGENDFMVCLKESFPQLKTRRLTRVEWCKVRRLMGKPRRCSSAFFAEERAELARKRSSSSHIFTIPEFHDFFYYLVQLIEHPILWIPNILFVYFLSIFKFKTNIKIQPKIPM